MTWYDDKQGGVAGPGPTGLLPSGGGEVGVEPPPDTPIGPNRRGALLRLLIVVAAGVAAAVVFHLVTLLVVIFAIVAMIMLHEGGHFATAKWAHMKVTEYFLGFGPRVWSVRFGETEYGVKAIPAGGYVKIVGMSNLEEVSPADEARTYRQAPFGRRLSVALAGSVVHVILAIILMWAAFALVGVYSSNKVAVGPLSRFANGPTPAQQAGFRRGDVFVSVDGHQVNEASLQSFIRNHAGDRLTVVVRRDGRLVTLHVTPVRADSVTYTSTGAGQSSAPTGDEGVIGVTLVPPLVRSNPADAFVKGVAQTWHLATGSVAGLVHVFSPQGLHAYVSQATGSTASNSGATSSSQSGGSGGGGRLYSIIGAARLATQAANAGLFNVLLVILADINVFVAIFNMVPLLPLDGGHVAIAIYERIRSRRGRRYYADLTKMLPLTYAVFFILVVIGIGALYLDIAHPAPNPFH